jgi:SAM-dependent methyltransferase
VTVAEDIAGSTITWTEDGVELSAGWRSENRSAAPTQVKVIGDDITADAAFRLARSGIGLLWRGDYHNGRQLLQALDRRFTRNHAGRAGSGRGRGAARGGRRTGRGSVRADAAETFSAERAFNAERSRLLGLLLVELGEGYALELRRAPEVGPACEAAYGVSDGSVCMSLTELGGVLSAHQWQLRGVAIDALGERIHPRYGVFSPIRGEYVDLVATTRFGSAPPATAFDLGTGTGVLAAVLLHRGIGTVVATDINPRAVACAQENLERLGFAGSASVVETDLFPPGRADLIVCNPPWLPADPTSALELGIYDPGSLVLRRFIDGLSDHLTDSGEGWLILSDLAEHLGLRTRQEFEECIRAAGLQVCDRYDTAPRHRRVSDADDALHQARSAETTSLWRLRRNA